MTQILFYVFSAVAIGSAMLMVTRKNPVASLLFMVATLASVAGIYVLLEAHFLAAIQVIVYAGAIMVLFVFVVMLLNLGQESAEQERRWLEPGAWVGPSLLALILLLELGYVLARGGGESTADSAVAPKAVAQVLFGPYLLGVELASMLLLAGLVGAYHLGRRERRGER